MVMVGDYPWFWQNSLMITNRSATMRDVAQAAGVSIGTVDRVLHNRGRFSAETAERVRASAKRLNCLPNQAASNLKRATTHTFVVVLPYPDQDGGFWCQVVKGVNQALQELSHHYVRVRFAHYDRFTPESFASICAELADRSDATTDRGIDGWSPAGIILAPTLRAASQRLVERTRPVPVVVLDGELPDVRLLCSISQESLEGGLLAAKLLQVMSPGGRFASIRPTQAPPDRAVCHRARPAPCRGTAVRRWRWPASRGASVAMPSARAGSVTASAHHTRPRPR